MTVSPPLFRDYGTEDVFLAALGDAVAGPELAQIRALTAKGLPPATSVITTSLLFGYSPRFFVRMARYPKLHYRRFTIPKGKKKREIRAPKVGLKSVQSWFGHHLSLAYSWPAHVHGFVPKRSIVTAAQTHCDAKWVVSIDLRDFFGSVHLTRIIPSLQALGYSGDGVWLLANILTLDGSLPQGAPSSPAMANLCFSSTDTKLSELAAERGWRLTRYADDITVSGTDAEVNCSDVAAKVCKVLTDDGWTVSDQKTELMVAPSPLRVLGLLVDGPTPRLPRRYRHKLRMMKYILSRGLELRQGDSFRGHVSFANSVDKNNG